MAYTYSYKCPFSSIEDIKNKHITVMGLGLNGGGEAAVRFFLKKGAFVTVTDMKTSEQLKPTIDSIEKALAEDPEYTSVDKTKLIYHLGEHRIEDFETADCVIKNPGVKIEGNKYLAAAKAIETDLSIFLRFTNAPIIAVTGSKGKSSTVSSIHYGLKASGYKCFLGGNITVSPLTFFDEVNQDTPVVIEFSSWQLADLRGRGVLRPYISIITKIVPDHQNWYGNMKDYVADKRLIFANQSLGDYAIFDAEGDEPGTDPVSSDAHKAFAEENPKADISKIDFSTWGNFFATEAKSHATVLRYGTSPLPKGVYGVWQDKDENGDFCGKVLLPQMDKPEIILRKMAVPGNHMKVNVLNAALVLYLMGIPAEKTAQVLGEWQGIEHRLQYFHQWKNQSDSVYKFYNDSCATVPEAAAAATQAFGKPITLITGGTDKGLDLSPFIETVTATKDVIPVKDIYLLEGSATEKLLPHFEKATIKYHGPYKSLNVLLEELKQNLEKTNPVSKEMDSPEIVVFSPGATSFGMFNNEFHRGHQFMQSVKELFK
ncbi:MAG: UDP-N-acetylmuramoyl-L-alanine--D-glutamate ligase [Treponema sp.]|nr:UDP-N-acetylmuramoyl-L-alanine--D-glutamate ligase [Treponema sp.]